MPTIPLRALKPGSEIGIDSRIEGRDAEIDSLANSIAAVGLLQPLGVWQDPESKQAYVVFGNRRLAALQKLVDSETPIPVEYLKGTKAQMLELSFIENVERVELSEIDQFEAVAGMIRVGAEVSQIAKDLGIEEDHVKRLMALGGLHPTIIAAWRADRMSVEAAQVFTVLTNPAEQVAVFNRLSQNWEPEEQDEETGDEPAFYLQAYSVRREIAGQEQDTAKHLKFVGEEAYLAAGGRLAPDLFHLDQPVILDPAILADLAYAGIEHKIEALKAEGWGNVCSNKNRPDKWWQMRPLGEPTLTKEEQAQIKALVDGGDSFEARAREREITETARVRSLTPEQRAESWTCVGLDWDGELVIECGRNFVTAEARQAAKDEAPAEKDAAPPGETGGIIDDLRVNLTDALGRVVSTDYPRAMDLFLATALAPKQGSPCQIAFAGADVPRSQADPAMTDFASALEYASSLTREEQTRLFTQIVGASIDVRSSARQKWAGEYDAVVKAAKGVKATLAHLEPEALLATIRLSFNAEAYFARAPGQFAQRAITESLGPDALKPYAKSRKIELAAAAVKIARESGWLPVELRTPAYVTPFAAPAKVEAAEGGEKGEPASGARTSKSRPISKGSPASKAGKAKKVA